MNLFRYWPVVAAAASLAGCIRDRTPRESDYPQPGAQPEVAAIRALELAVAAADAPADFTCLFYRHERVGGHLGTKQRMRLKVRRRPFSLYARWVDAAKIGSELLYVEGRYENKAFLRMGGPLGWLLAPVHLPLDAPIFTQQSRHPLTDLDLGTAPRAILASARRAQGAGALRAERLGVVETHGQHTEGFEVVFPEGPEYYAHRCRLWFDPTTRLMVRVEAFDAAGDLLEDYAFAQVQVDVGLTDRDFDPETYGFSFTPAATRPAPASAP